MSLFQLNPYQRSHMWHLGGSSVTPTQFRAYTICNKFIKIYLCSHFASWLQQARRRHAMSLWRCAGAPCTAHLTWRRGPPLLPMEKKIKPWREHCRPFETLKICLPIKFVSIFSVLKSWKTIGRKITSIFRQQTSNTRKRKTPPLKKKIIHIYALKYKNK